MSFTVIIPARYASTRLPGKPLLDIAGKPMIQRVYEQACLSRAQRVLIATDDQRIVDVAIRIGAEVCMTSSQHESGTDRLQEVVSRAGFAEDHIVVNVQGDEPLIPPAVINQVAANLAANATAGIATLVETIVDMDTVFNPNAVKVVMDSNSRALYFSRAPIPWSRDNFNADYFNGKNKGLPPGIHYYRHIGIYAYRVSQLNQFVSWPASALEVTEKLEQLRALEHGVTILAELACEPIPAGIDTLEDLAAVRALF
jgi:3-deoxy-manno-octulosonate cytidylyltransferase (CMP-KDO synthetase)